MFYIINNESMKKDPRIRVLKLKAARLAVKGPIKVVDRDQIPIEAKIIPFTYYYKGTKVSAIYSTEPVSVTKNRKLCKEAYNVSKVKRTIKQSCESCSTKDKAKYLGFVIFEI